jgi:hypothetical protein
VVEERSGDVASALAIVGAAVFAVNHRPAFRSPAAEQFATRLIYGSMAAAATDTAIQGARGDLGATAYAATGLLPAVSLGALRGLHRHPSAHEVASLAALGVNAGVLGYELVTRSPDIVRGREDASGYGSLLASLGGFVVARRFASRA